LSLMSEERIIDFAKTALMDELYTSAIYHSLSNLYGDAPISEELLELSEMESEHANFWINFLERRDIDTSNFIISNYRVSFLTYIYRLLGVGLTLKILEIGERNAIRHYSMMLKSPQITDEEKKAINQILKDELGHEEEFEEYESRYKFFINSVATIFTQMSGALVTVLSVSIGIAGAYGKTFDVVIAGLIVGLSGALNTITGFYFFSRTQKQVKVEILSRLKMAAESAPKVFVQRVIKYMKRKEISEETSRFIAEEASRKQGLLNRIIAEEEYGIREEALGNPFKTSIYAGLYRIIGTILPLTPYFFDLPIQISIPISILITLFMLALTGFIVAISAEIDIKNKIIELTIGGLILTSLTFLVGKLTSILVEIITK